jgi:hypothetical protein
MTEILRFEMNVPAEVALKYAGPGKPIEGRYGNRVMYTLADNRVMCQGRSKTRPLWRRESRPLHRC